ncbi:MAG TPA: prepilin-type N-terminal cleavage/methylation domain-containing protein [Gemmataceae bacterium]
MARVRVARRRAYTLIELLVAMAVIVALASIALLVVPDALDNDRTTEGAAITRQTLMIAKSRAARDQAPRGVRLVVSIDPNNVAKAGNSQWVTELQYTEKLPVYVPTNPGLGPTDPNAPCVRFIYSFDTAGNVILAGANAPQCWIDNLLPDDTALILAAIPPNSPTGGLLSLFSLGFSARLQGLISPPTTGSAGPGTTKLIVALDNFPTPQLGASGAIPTPPNPFITMPVYESFQFGITTPPRPLLGEPAVQLPGNICIDLASSGLPFGTDFDVIFLPNGQVDPSCSAGGLNQLFLWVRDYTKNGGDPIAYPTAVYAQGGEQQVVALKLKSGALGAFPIAWPPSTPFQFALQGATAPQ